MCGVREGSHGAFPQVWGLRYLSCGYAVVVGGVGGDWMAVYYVELRLTPHSARPEIAAYVSDAWIVAARDEGLQVGGLDCVAFGDVALAAMLAVMWVQRVP